MKISKKQVYNELRLLLLPFSLIYGSITFVRNKLFDWGVFSVYTIPGKSICIGNLSTGGTGKSPHTLWLAHHLISEGFEVALLSRGYGRSTKGFIEVKTEHSAEHVGDEPLMFKWQLKDEARVFVCENRKYGVIEIKKNCPNAIILLDDAFQHRRVKVGFQLLISDYQKPYFRDFVLPAGDLREFRSGFQRANAIVFSKSPEDDKPIDARYFSECAEKPLFFSSIRYGETYALTGESMTLNQLEYVVLVTGIANPAPLEAYLNRFCDLESLQFVDHHNYTAHDLLKIKQKFDKFAGHGKAIVTTEKDAVRLLPWLRLSEYSELKVLVQPMQIKFRNEQEIKELINQYVRAI